MKPDFWHQRWHDNQIGFHQSAPTPLLLEHWPALGVPAGAKVFVPLAGKSLDMAWLASQGYAVLGVELSPLAIAQFFAEHGLQPDIRDSRYGRHYAAGGIELVVDQAAPPRHRDPRAGIDVGHVIGDGQDTGDMVRGREAGHPVRLHPELLCKVWHPGRGSQSGTGGGRRAGPSRPRN